MFGFSWLKNPIVLILAIILVLLLAVPFSPLHKYYFPDLNPMALKLLIEDRIVVDDAENMLYAINGLSAPENIENAHAYSIDNSTPKINLEIDFNKLLCWLSSQPEPDENCYTKQELDKIIDKNKILINRYEDIYKYNRFDSNLQDKELLGQNLILTHKLYVAYLRSEFQDKKSFHKIIRDFNHKRILVSQEGTLIEKAIFQVLLGLTINQLEYHLIHYPDIVNNYDREIVSALNDLTSTEFNIDGFLRKEYETLNTLFCLYEELGKEPSVSCDEDLKNMYIPAEFYTNDFYNRFFPYKEIIELNAIELNDKCNSMQDNDIEFSKTRFLGDIVLHFPLFPSYPGYKLLLSGSLKGCEIIVNFKVKQAKIRQLKVYTELISSKLDRDKYNHYLQDILDKDIVTGKPFVYNKTKEQLEFPSNKSTLFSTMSMKFIETKIQ